MCNVLGECDMRLVKLVLLEVRMVPADLREVVL
jgi:hypothetical protein